MSTLALFPAEPGSLDSSDAQCTPRDLALELGAWGTDPATNPRSHIQAEHRYMLELGHDGLALEWFGSVFLNGPYSNPLPWCERLRAHPEPWCSLWKLDTTTRWFAVLMAAGASWAPFRKRLVFERPGNTAAADFTSVLIWRDWEVPVAVQRRLWMPGGAP